MARQSLNPRVQTASPRRQWQQTRTIAEFFGMQRLTVRGRSCNDVVLHVAPSSDECKLIGSLSVVLSGTALYSNQPHLLPHGRVLQRDVR